MFPITLPPLRERPEDIPILARHFLQDAAGEYELPAPSVTPEALELLVRYRWPGNVRQLRAMCERWVIQCNGGELSVEHMPGEFRGGTVNATENGGAFYVDESVPLHTLLGRIGEQVERAYLHKALSRNRGHLVKTAEGAGITRRTLYARMKALGLEARDYK